MVQVLIPDLGEGIDKVKIVAWHARVGDQVTEDDDIVELVTDKAVFHVPAPKAGVLKAIRVKAGEEVRPDAVLGLIDHND